MKSKAEWSEPVVWVMQDKARIEHHRPKYVHDTSLAGRFGTRRTILDHNARPWKPGDALSHIAGILGRSYRPDVDFLLPIGSPLLIGLVLAYACTTAVREGHDAVKVLLWNARMRGGAGDYEVVSVPLDRIAEITEIAA